MEQLFRVFSKLPLRVLHAIGAVMGWVVYGLASSYRKRWHHNREQAGLSVAQLRPAVAENGRMIFELPRIWFGKPVPCQWRNKEVLDAAYARGKGIVFLTPHMGCFEITAQVVAEKYHERYGNLTVLYRPARQAWLAKMMEYVRNRPGLETAPTTLAGVRQMIKALRKGEAVGLLPDHVPPQGQGVWAPFFGKPAYTMTLAAKLAQQTGASIIWVWGERLPRGQGYVLHCGEIPQLPEDLTEAATAINKAMEEIILSHPSQYMWSYARYREPRAQPSTPESAHG